MRPEPHKAEGPGDTHSGKTASGERAPSLASARRAGAWQAGLRTRSAARTSLAARQSLPAWPPPARAREPAGRFRLTQAQQPGSGRRRQDGPGQRGPHREGAAARLPQAVAGPRQHYRLRPPHRYPSRSRASVRAAPWAGVGVLGRQHGAGRGARPCT